MNRSTGEGSADVPKKTTSESKDQEGTESDEEEGSDEESEEDSDSVGLRSTLQIRSAMAKNHDD